MADVNKHCDNQTGQGSTDSDRISEELKSAASALLELLKNKNVNTTDLSSVKEIHELANLLSQSNRGIEPTGENKSKVDIPGFSATSEDSSHGFGCKILDHCIPDVQVTMGQDHDTDSLLSDTLTSKVQSEKSKSSVELRDQISAEDEDMVHALTETYEVPHNIVSAKVLTSDQWEGGDDKNCVEKIKIEEDMNPSTSMDLDAMVVKVNSSSSGNTSYAILELGSSRMAIENMNVISENVLIQDIKTENETVSGVNLLEEHLDGDHVLTKTKFMMKSWNKKQDGEGKPHHCRLCGLRYQKKCALKRHMIWKHQEYLTAQGLFDKLKDLETVSTGQCFKNMESSLHTESKNKYVCPLCGKLFKQQTYLKAHFLMHIQDTPYFCKFCRKCFKTDVMLSDHMMELHASQFKMKRKKSTHDGSADIRTSMSLKCSECDKTFSSKKSLEFHLEIHKDKKHYACKLCDKTFLQHRIYDLKRHIRQTHGKLEVERHILYLDSSSLQDVSYKNEPGERRKEGSLRKNKKDSKSSQILFKCPYCPKVSKYSGNLKYHMEIHTNDRKYSCKICGKAFLSHRKNDLQRHIKQTHGIAENAEKYMKYLAVKKGDSASSADHQSKGELFTISEGGVEIPKKRGKPSKLVGCEICGDVFKNKAELQVHALEQHEEHYTCVPKVEALDHDSNITSIIIDDPFAGPSGSSSVDGSQVLPHDVPPSVVANVEDVNSVLSSLPYHSCDGDQVKTVVKRSGPGDDSKMYKCPLCPKVMKYAYSLKYHMNVHENAKGFACRLCNKTFLTHKKYDLKRHIKYTHHVTEVEKYIISADSLSHRNLILKQKQLHVSAAHEKDKKAGDVGISEQKQDRRKQVKNVRKSKRITARKSKEIQEDDVSINIIEISSQNACTTDAVNSNETEYECPVCKELFHGEVQFKKHVGSHKSKKYVCHLCNKSYDNIKVLRSHIKQTHVVGNSDLINEAIDLYCSNCGQQFFSSQDLERHYLRRDCAMLGKKQQSQNRNLRKAEVESVYERNESTLETNGIPTGSDTHFESVVGKDIGRARRKPPVLKSVYICFYCKKDCLTKKYLVQHLWTHERTKRYRCKLCDMSFNRIFELTMHMSDSHENEQIPIDELSEAGQKHVCSLCGESFKNRYILKNHYVIHNGTKTNKCKICDKMFTRYSDVKRHIRQMHDRQENIRDLDEFVERMTVEDATSASVSNEHVGFGGMTGTLPVNCSFSDETQNNSANFGEPEGLTLPEHISITEENTDRELSVPLSCDVCQSEFSSVNALQMHRLVHVLPEREKCEFCDKSFFHLDRHIWEMHEDEVTAKSKEDSNAVTEHGESCRSSDFSCELYLCVLCGNETSEPRSESGACSSCSLLAHQNVSEVQMPHYCCSICGLKVMDADTLQRHLASHEEDKERPHKCDQCEKAFKTKRAWELHVIDHSNSKDCYCCEECGLTFSCLYKVRRHRHSVHQKHKPKATHFSCHICLFKSKSSEHLWDHLDIHSSNDELVCPFCDKVFMGPGELAVHGRNVHAGSDRQFSCPRCHFVTEEKYLLEKHMRVMHPEFQGHSCNFCESKFLLLHDLRFHVISKHEKKNTRNLSIQELALRGKYKGPFPCTECPKIFQRRVSLNAHMRVHFGVYKHACDFCEKKFRTPAEWRIHRRLHTKEKPYACQYCDATFSRQSSWVRHKRKHLGELPHLCEICGGRFTALKGLHKHKLIHEREAAREGSAAQQTICVEAIQADTSQLAQIPMNVSQSTVTSFVVKTIPEGDEGSTYETTYILPSDSIVIETGDGTADIILATGGTYQAAAYTAV
ncbi:zinc finger protein 729 [Aplysia californica]|uniref:Zinc finger protein 729 n=1 Tax=Aplysia californica TaxID=6500 RepID=A0ABM0JT95_APLCA|nr:zinc finger protein 729 [Aplysia californica]